VYTNWRTGEAAPIRVSGGLLTPIVSEPNLSVANHKGEKLRMVQKRKIVFGWVWLRNDTMHSYSDVLHFIHAYIQIDVLVW